LTSQTRPDEALDLIVSSNLLEAEPRATLAREGVADEGTLLGRVSWLLPDRPLSAEIRDVLAAGPLRGAACGTSPARSTSRPIPGS
jgi:hypothetical protein